MAVAEAVNPNKLKTKKKFKQELLLVMDRKSYIRFHLAPLSLTWSDLERSIQVTGLQWPISTNLIKITTELLLMMDIYEVSFGTIFFDLE